MALLDSTPLERAARATQHAPSVFHTQPWNWQLTGRTKELFADPDHASLPTSPRRVPQEVINVN